MTMYESIKKYAARATAAALICTGIAGAFVYEARQKDALQDELARSNATIVQLAAECKHLEESLGRIYSIADEDNRSLSQIRSEIKTRESMLEDKIKMTNEELGRMSKERCDALAYAQKRDLDFDTYHFTFDQKTVYSGERANVLKTSPVDVFDHQLIPDKTQYLKMSDQEIQKARTDYIGANEFKEISKPAPQSPPTPPSPPPQERRHEREIFDARGRF